MREIKFRGKKIDGGKWVFGYLAKHKEKLIIVNDIFQDGGYDFIFNYVEEDTLCCLTGLKDKNGKFIYEGDILECQDRIVKVVWNNEFACWDSLWISYISDLCSNGISPVDFKFRAIVIGNIHENPELLK